MLTFFDNIRSKPRATRKRYALFTSIVLISILIGAWSVTLVHKAQEYQALADQQASVASTAPGPLSALAQNISAGFNDVTKNISAANPFVASASVATSTSSTDNTTNADSVVAATSSVATSTFGQIIITDSPGQ